MNKTDKIYVSGHRGLVGSAIMRHLEKAGYSRIITRTHHELDLCNQSAVDAFFEAAKPDYVFLAAAKVGGIGANSTYPADFIYQNMMIGFNVVHAAYKAGTKKLLNLGSSCIYPKLAPQPLREDYLLTDALEPTNEAYAIAKIAVIKLCRYYNAQYGTNYVSVMPTNLYGPQDTYDVANGHVLPAMIQKLHDAKVSGKDNVTRWGDGSPDREFLYSEDLADAVIFLMEHKNASDIGEFVNIGTGEDLSIKDLAGIIHETVYADVQGRTCNIEWDSSKPNGTPRKLLDVSRLNAMGWKAKTGLREGIAKAYATFRENADSAV
jgi:GDP-L-fucose synthase